MTQTQTLPLLSDLAQKALRDPNLKGNAAIWSKPYLTAMLYLNTMSDTYGEDDASSVVAYALSNLTYWRGDVAKEVKAALKAHQAAHRARRR